MLSDEAVVPLLLLHIPHTSTVVPAHVRQSLFFDDIELKRELLVMTDWYTDPLFNHALDFGGMMFVNSCSRLAVDPGRFPDHTEEVMASRGMGVIYTKASDGRLLRGNGLGLNRQDILSRYHVPYAEAIANQVSRILDRYGLCLILDGHSHRGCFLMNSIRPGTDRKAVSVWIPATPSQIDSSQRRGFCSGTGCDNL